MIKISHLSKKFGNLEVLKDINLDIEEGEVVCIIGPSGSGKSTFLRCINQLESPSGGIVEYEGKNLLDKKCDIRKFREEVGMVFQRFNLFPLKTVAENVMMAPVLTKHMNKEEILAKSRQENQYQDERDKMISAQAGTYGAIGMAVLFVVLFLIRLLMKGGTAYDLLAMYFGYLAVTNIYKSTLLKGKTEIFAAVIYSIITLVWLVLYVWKG